MHLVPVGGDETTFQIVGISLMLYRERMLGFGAYAVGEVLLYVAAALTLWSMIEYLRAALPAMRGAENAGSRR